ncbi:MAG: DUF4093 domain-containing protein [Oscillospiraceae bacterium]|nr:DUF4093 domain-containing protein [Oscillospiraceae bacterium]
MLKIKEAIVVEGRYDKNTLRQVVDAVVVETAGFGIFKDEKQLQYLRALAKERGLIVLTDADGAGFVIRNYLKGSIPPEQVKHAYIPDVSGKEKRKRTSGKEGKLGVEGMSPKVLEEALRKAGATFLNEAGETAENGTPITKADFVRWGLSGSAESASQRRALQQKLNLPEHLSANGLLEALNTFYNSDEVERLLRELKEKGGV